MHLSTSPTSPGSVVLALTSQAFAIHKSLATPLRASRCCNVEAYFGATSMTSKAL